MGKYVGVDWAGKRWVVVSITEESIDVGTQPSMQAVWDQHGDADLILVDIPIGLPSDPDSTPRPCDEEAREVVSGSRYSTIFDVPCRAAVQTSDYDTAVERNDEQIDDDSLGPQKWGFAERIHEADIFMRNTDTEGAVRESHPKSASRSSPRMGRRVARRQTRASRPDWTFYVITTPISLTSTTL